MQHFEHKKTPDELAPVWTKGERLEPEKATGRKQEGDRVVQLPVIGLEDIGTNSLQRAIYCTA